MLLFAAVDNHNTEEILIPKISIKQAGTYSCVVVQKFRKIVNYSQRDMEVVVERNEHENR